MHLYCIYNLQQSDSMGKKGVLLDNGKQAQSSMALYWKASQNKKLPPKTAKQPKEQTMQDRAAGSAASWKQHKQKMIAKLYSKPQKKQQQSRKEEQQREKEMQEQLEQDLLQKHMAKSKPVSIPGFKGSRQLEDRKEYESVQVGREETNVLKFPQGQPEMTHEQIVQLLRERKAKKMIDRGRRAVVEREEDVIMMEEPFKMPTKKKEESQEQEKKQQQAVQVWKEQQQAVQVWPQIQAQAQRSIFKSQLLQRIQKGQYSTHPTPQGQSNIPAQQPAESQSQPHKVQITHNFIPRAVRHK